MENEKLDVSKWDAADYIETKDDVFEYLAAAIEENNPEFLISALGDIARSKGMTRLSRELNLDRKGLYKAFSPDGNPSFLTVAKVAHSLGYRIALVPR